MRRLMNSSSLPNLELLGVLVRRELFSRFRRHRLGSSWIFLSPLLTSVVMIAAFYGIFGVSSGSLTNYSFYVLSGVTLVQFINASLINISASVNNAKGIYSRIKVPFLTFPIAVSITQVIYFGIGIIYCLVLLLAIPQKSLNLLQLALSMIALALFLNGIGMSLVVFSSKYPDTHTFLPILLQALTYISPIFYPETIWPDAVRKVLIWNPFLYFIRSFRDSFVTGSSYNLSIVLLLSGCITTIVGSQMLIRSRRNILKIL